MATLVDRQAIVDAELLLHRMVREQRPQPTTHRSWKPLNHQIPPPGDWFLWLLLGGRGSGKTDADAHYLNEHVNGPPCIPGYPGGHRPAIIAPTLGDATEACVNGPSGLKAHNPSIRLVQGLSGAHVVWPNGTQAKLFGAFTPEDVERLRAGGNTCIVWAEELAAWVRLDKAWDNMLLGLRLGPQPRVIASTTPKPRPKLKALLSLPDTIVTRATTHDNPHLNPQFRERVINRFAGSQLGRQEISGELIDQIAGALWSRDLIESHRVFTHPPLRRVVVGVDPSGGDGPDNDEQGIVVAGIDEKGKGYCLDDVTQHAKPEVWGQAVVDAYHRWQADYVVAEVNFGGDMVSHVIRTIDANVPVKVIRASRGKFARADPVASLDNRGMISQVGSLALLEDEMCTWEPFVSDWSPNRMDARVWAFTELMVDSSEAGPLNDDATRFLASFRGV